MNCRHTLKSKSCISRVNKIPLNKAFQLVKFRTRKKPDPRIFSGFEPRVFFLLEWIWYIFIHVELLLPRISFWDGRLTIIALLLNPTDTSQLLTYLTSQFDMVDYNLLLNTLSGFPSPFLAFLPLPVFSAGTLLGSFLSRLLMLNILLGLSYWERESDWEFLNLYF